MNPAHDFNTKREIDDSISSPSPQHTSAPPDQTTTFPVESLTNHQREVFKRYIDATKKDDKRIREPIWLALVLIREKPATDISNFNDHPDCSITAKEIAKAFDLVYHQHTSNSLDVARTSWWLDILPTTGKGVSESAFFRRLGCFYGYHERDIEHFIETTGWDTHLQEFVEDGVLKAEEAAYIEFLPQRYDPDKSHERAIEAGRRIREVISDCTEKWNFSYLDEHADWVYQKELEQCIP